jgi:hypothetical protein
MQHLQTSNTCIARRSSSGGVCTKDRCTTSFGERRPVSGYDEKRIPVFAASSGGKQLLLAAREVSTRPGRKHADRTRRRHPLRARGKPPVLKSQVSDRSDTISDVHAVAVSVGTWNAVCKKAAKFTLKSVVDAPVSRIARQSLAAIDGAVLRPSDGSYFFMREEDFFHVTVRHSHATFRSGLINTAFFAF